jgi:GPI ethanolamine phosphate transferase 1
LIISLLMPLAHRLHPNTHYLHRLMAIFLTFAPTFVILTISYEGLFYVVYCITLLTWVRLEHYSQIFTDPPTTKLQGANGSITAATSVPQFRPLTLSDARVAFFFFVLLQSAFFSTGNIASISSFSLESVCRLLPVFNPFSQGALLIFKLMIPFTLVSANLGILNKRLGVAPSALFMVAMGMSDVLTLHFFWVVKDEGSWLEIGSTICHFVVASLLCVFVAGLEGVSAMFISRVEVERGPNEKPPAQVNGTAIDTVADRVVGKAHKKVHGAGALPKT